MARILYCAFDRVPAPKGASRHILALLRGIRDAGHAVDACVLTSSAQAPLAGVNFLPPPAPRGDLLERALAFGEQVSVHARSGGYDLIQVRSPWEGLPLVRWPGHPPLVFEVNGLPSIEWPANIPGLGAAQPLLAKLRRRELAMLAGASAIVTPSRITAEWIRAQSGREAVVIPNGVDLAAWQVDRHPLSGEILYQGSFSPWQGLATAVEALALLPPPVRLRAVGPRERGEAGRLLAHARALGVGERLLLPRAVAPALVARMLARAELAIAPARDDARNRLQGACPLKLLEYLAAGCPVVASRLPMVEELVSHGRSAWLVPPDDPAALAAGIRYLLERPDQRAILSAGARATAARYTWSRAVDSLLSVYAGLLGPPQPAPA